MTVDMADSVEKWAFDTIHAAAENHGKVLRSPLVLYYSTLMDAPGPVSFDGWTLDRASGDLARGGEVTRLAQQPLRVLLELIENAGQVVTRERLVQVLWPRGVVDFDNSLNGIVRRLRVALGGDSETPRYIETL